MTSLFHRPESSVSLCSVIFMCPEVEKAVWTENVGSFVNFLYVDRVCFSNICTYLYFNLTRLFNLHSATFFCPRNLPRRMWNREMCVSSTGTDLEPPAGIQIQLKGFFRFSIAFNNYFFYMWSLVECSQAKISHRPGSGKLLFTGMYSYKFPIFFCVAGPSHPATTGERTALLWCTTLQTRSHSTMWSSGSRYLFIL